MFGHLALIHFVCSVEHQSSGLVRRFIYLLKSVERILGKPHVSVWVCLQRYALVLFHEVCHNLASKQAPKLQEHIPGKQHVMHLCVQARNCQHIVVDHGRFNSENIDFDALLEILA